MDDVEAIQVPQALQVIGDILRDR
jgi:hypothetical protein